MIRLPDYIGRNYRGILFTVLLVAGVATAVWVVSDNPLRGVVSVTVINTDGTTRALQIDVAELTSSGFTYQSEQLGLIVAAVPNPQRDKTAFVVRTQDRVMHVSVGDVGGRRSTPIVDGIVGVPSWSMDGRSIAVAVQDSEGDMGKPESWTVMRAVTNGDSLTVGHGYKPFPSPNQRTYALTSKGVALLAYSDTEPNLIIASPVPVPVTTPFAMSQDGMRIAWVAPADKSLQVFENVNGYFVPLLLSKASTLQTLVFSPDGKYILGGSYTGATTTLQLVTISSNKVSVVGEVSGFVDLHTWNYEK